MPVAPPSHAPADAPIRPLFGLPIRAASFGQAVGMLAEAADERGGRARVVVTPNVDHLVRLDGMPALKAEYACADYVFADGMPVVWASRLLGEPLPERVTGADLFVALCREAQRRRWQVVVLGGAPGAEAELQARFAERYPGARVTVLAPSMQFDPVGEEGKRAAQAVRALSPDVVFVCLGMPKQERWALLHAPAFEGGVMLCVGAAMEFALGLSRRAPGWMQRTGTEWLWRLAANPRRLWRRYLVDDPRFLALCWREWRRRSPPPRTRK